MRSAWYQTVVIRFRAMRAAAITTAVLVLLAASSLPADEKKSEVPSLEILTPAGAGKNVKVFNDDVHLFFVRRAGDDRGKLLRGVAFVLYKAGGRPGRPSDRMAKSEDTPRWGNPPSTFALPLEERTLPVGGYRLRATKPGWKKAEVGVVQCEFAYRDLDVIHEKSRYAASLSFRLSDRTEKRESIDLVVRIESANGALVDGAKHRIRPEKQRRGHFDSVAPLRLSSNAKKPKKDASPVTNRALRIVPGCRLVVFLDRTKFSWPVPLPPARQRSSSPDPEDTDRGRGR
ncbi:MAG: hypothetical protein ABFS86_20745 [Planctomycetota bacterium]